MKLPAFTRAVESLEPRRLLSGLTLITHGQGGSAGGDVARTADFIAQRAGGAAQYVLALEGDSGDVAVKSFTHDADTPTMNAVSNGETIVKLDWGEVNTLPTPAIASATADFLI